jgi:hypothetical protein
MVGHTSSAATERWIDGLLRLVNLPQSSPDGFHTAIILAPPSPELAGALLGAASVFESDPARHKPETFGEAVSYVTGRKLYDSILRKSKTERRIVLHAEFDVSKLPEMVARPSGIEARTEIAVPGRIFNGIPESEMIPRAKEFFRFCIRPVVILTTRPTELAEYFEAADLAVNVWEARDQCIRFATSNSLDDWFRSPILLATPEQTRNREWLSSVEPAAVIAIGWKSWKKPARWLWPSVTHFLVLDVRSEDIEYFRAYHDGTEGLQAAPLPTGASVGPQVVAFFEPVNSLPSDSDWDEEVDLD